MKAHPALLEGRGEGDGGRGEREDPKNEALYIPVYNIDIHIQNQTLKSNISKTVRDREKVLIEVR